MPLHEYSHQGTGFENIDYNFGNNPQGNTATISYSAEGTDSNSLAFKNRNSAFPQSINQQIHWD
ncbi:hypothetical protein CEXT_24591, partial [Caerostris extrusa]